MSARATDIRSRTQRPELRVVRRRRSRSLIKKTHARKAALYVGAGIVAAAIVAVVLLEQVVLAQSAFRLSDIRKDLQVAEERHEELLLEAAQLDSSARIERYAREVLGMIDPAPGGIQYIVADIRHPRQVRNGVGRKHRTTLPTQGLASGDPYVSDGAGP